VSLGFAGCDMPVDRIDSLYGARKAHIKIIIALVSASIGDRESGNAPALVQGSVVTSSQQFLTAIERPRCSRCQTRMMLERVSPGPIGFEHRLFECPKCDHVEITVIASDPFTSKAAGWLGGELRAPN
jgi:hypothetical protein